MSLIPFDWNVIIRGFWNRAIFTPNKVSEHLFGLAKGTTLQVLVPIDGMNSTKIIHNNILVSVKSEILEIATEKFEFPKIKECLDIGVKSLNWLKETPVFAGGYNIRYKLTDQNAVSIANIIKSPIDDILSDASCNIKEKSNIRSIEYGNGEINLITQIDRQNDVNVTFNFNKNSTDIDEIINWFSISTSDLESKTQALLGNILK
jgi:hypothetical protein